MSTRMMAKVLKGAVVALAVAALSVPAAVAKGPGGGGGHGGGGGGGGTGEVAPNSLSVPAVFVGGTNPYGLTCDGTTSIDPSTSGTPYTGYTLPGYYYVQGVNSWQATCDNATSATVTAAWGDNLGGDARLKVGSPIRVEVGLFDTAVNTYTGWEVLKLEPAELDRISPYGTLANDDGNGGYTSNPVTPFGETRVWAAGATLHIVNADTSAPVYNGAASAEINSTGRVVYGYNLRVTAAGDYTITYTFPGVTITGTDLGTISADGHSVSYTVTVSPGGGGGGGGKGHKG